MVVISNCFSVCLSESKTTLMDCSSCKQRIGKNELFRVHATACNDYRSAPSRRVCSDCLVGYNIPVLRPSTGDWEIGRVLSRCRSNWNYCEDHKQCQLKFTDGVEECVTVHTEPYEAYAQTFDDMMDTMYASVNVFDHLSVICPSSHRTSDIDICQHNYQRDLHENDHFKEIHSTSTEFGDSIFDSGVLLQPDDSQEPLALNHPLQEASSLDENFNLFGSPVKTEVQNNVFSPGNYHSEDLLRCSNTNVVRNDSPANSQKSSSSSKSQASSSSSSKRDDIASSTHSNNRYPKLWTRKEDELLLKSVASKNKKLCWPQIALDIPDRTGKQCRERYLNHLGPHLKHAGWSALEDATIFRLNSVLGSKWSQIARSLPGRTDNGIKNRFHYLQRRFRRRIGCIPESKEMRLLTKHVAEHPLFRSLFQNRFVTKDTAARILAESSSLMPQNRHGAITGGDIENQFGPFDLVTESIGCGRCGLIIPSKETGTTICRRTRWCETCTEVSLVISGDLLRAILLVRKDWSDFRQGL